MRFFAMEYIFWSSSCEVHLYVTVTFSYEKVMGENVPSDEHLGRICYCKVIASRVQLRTLQFCSSRTNMKCY